MVKYGVFRRGAGEANAIERYYLSIVRGERGGAVAVVVLALLAVLAFLYRGVVAARRAAYRLGLRPVRRVPCPVLSVGNVVVGGTGKTPMVEYLARYLAAKGRRVAIVSRGYGPRDEAGRNDEALILSENLAGVPQVLDSDRVRGSLLAIERFGADCVLLDDGFQHLRLGRDLDLVLLDALNPFGYGHLLPRGLLREPLSALRRASAVLITRADLAPPGRIAEVRALVRAVRSDLPIAEVVEEPIGLTRVAGAASDDGARAERPLEWLAGRDIFAFCGIGNPASFYRRLERLGARLTGLRTYPDHYRYRQQDVSTLARLAAATSAEALVTTQKDAVKLSRLDGVGAILALRIRAFVREGRKMLECLVDHALERHARPPGDSNAAAGIPCASGAGRTAEARP